MIYEKLYFRFFYEICFAHSTLFPSNCRELRSEPSTQILLNFCIALSLTLAVFLAAAERFKTSSMTGCQAAAVALHYLVLVVFMWMAIQAFNMVIKFVIVMHQHYSRFMLKCCIAGWGMYNNYIFC